jgi:hypothetical protein
VIFSTTKGGQIHFCHGRNNRFLVPDVCRATEGNGISISANVAEDPLKTCKIPSFGFTLFNKALIWLIKLCLSISDLLEGVNNSLKILNGNQNR